MSNDDKGLDALIKAGVDVNYTRKNKYTVLMAAASRGNIKCLELLLKAGADVNSEKILAAESDHNRCVEILLNQGADVNKQDSNARTALMLAANWGGYDIVD